MVLAIAGILAVFAAPASSLFENIDAAGASNEALFIISAAQKTAIAHQRAVWVRVTPALIEACYDPNCERPVSRISGTALRLEAPKKGRARAVPSLFSFDAQGRLQGSEAVTLEVAGKTIRVERKTGLARRL